VIDPAALQMVLIVLTGWLDRRESQAIAYLIEENRVLRRQLGGRRLRLTDDDRRRAETGAVPAPHVLICDRDRKWSGDVRRRLRDAGIRVVLIPERAPHANAYAERFVRSIKEECLNRLILIGERHVRRA
jgi:hypothetical protein